MSEFSILVCPVCRKQIEDSYEGGVCWDHERAQAVRVEVELPASANPTLLLAAYRYGEERRDEHWAIAEQRYLNTLTDAELRERLGPMGYVMQMGIKAHYRDLADRLNNPLFGPAA